MERFLIILFEYCILIGLGYYLHRFFYLNQFPTLKPQKNKSVKMRESKPFEIYQYFIFICYFIPIYLILNAINHNGFEYDLIIVIGFLIIEPILSIASSMFSKIFDIRENENSTQKMVKYTFPQILSIIALIILLINNSDFQFRIHDFIQYQNSNSILAADIPIKKNFIIYNLLSFIAFVLVILGKFRNINLDSEVQFGSNSSKEIIEFERNRIHKITEIQKFILQFSITIPLFIGSIIASDSGIQNFGNFIIAMVILVFILSMFSRGKPRFWGDRKIASFIRIPMIIAFLSIFYSMLLTYFGGV